MTQDDPTKYPDAHKYEDYYDEDLPEERCDLCDLPREECTCDDCGLMPDGTYSLAGTEWCDWGCKSGTSKVGSDTGEVK